MNSNDKTVSRVDFQALVMKEMADSVSRSYLMQGSQARSTRSKQFAILLEEKKLPNEGWDDLSIEMFLDELASMDSNNFPTRIGVGEREGRIYSDLVAKRHFRLCHGVGRSGDVAEPQPKAAGSSILSVLTNALLKDLCRTQVSRKIQDVFLCPTATGLSISLVLLTLKKLKPAAKYVIWPRVDQKSCFKSIVTAGLEPVVMEPKIVGEELKTDVEAMEEVISSRGVDTILCVLSTSSCFAPRACDLLEDIGKICKNRDIFHVVNNAYGLQSGKCTYSIAQAATHGRVDVFVQSTDKNLMVPVGGAIIAGFDEKLIKKIRQNYPGRASSSQMVDVFITLMSMGANDYSRLLQERRENFQYLKSKLTSTAEKFGEHVINSPGNQISIGMSLSTVANALPEPSQITKLGSMLFLRTVCGARVITPNENKIIDGHEFQGWGAHCNNYPFPYLTAAASIGMKKGDVDGFVEKLEDCLNKLQKSS